MTLKLSVLLSYFIAMGYSQAFDLMDQCPSDVENYLACSKIVEAKALANNKQVYRQGDALHIKSTDGEDLVISSKSDESDPLQNMHYAYLNYLPGAQAHLLFVLFYEGSAYALVNAHTGAIQAIDGYPVVSPNQTYLAVANASLAYNPTVLQIWRIAKGDFHLEYSEEPKEWGPGQVEWVDDTTLRVATNGYEIDGIKAPEGTPKHVSLKLLQQQWTLVK
jgi:hypothetical protein